MAPLRVPLLLPEMCCQVREAGFKQGIVQRKTGVGAVVDGLGHVDDGRGGQELGPGQGRNGLPKM
jgi:hypothetical protein